MKLMKITKCLAAIKFHTHRENGTRKLKFFTVLQNVKDAFL